MDNDGARHGPLRLCAASPEPGEAWWSTAAVRGVLSLVAFLVFVIGAASIAQHTIARQSLPVTAVEPVAVAAADRTLLTGADTAAGAAAGLMPASARSILKINRGMRYGDFVWNDRDVPPGPISVFVDLRLQLLSVYRGPHEIGSAVILYGTEGHQTPLGLYPVMSKDRDYWSRTYGAPMPFALRLTDDGVAIHGSDVRWGAATHGCIGVPLEFAEKLFKNIAIGDPVTIVRSPEPGSPQART